MFTRRDSVVGKGGGSRGRLRSELESKGGDPRMEPMYGFYLCLTPVVCGAPSAGRGGRERNGKVIRKGGRTSTAGEGSGALRAQAGFCFVSRASPGRSLQLCFCSSRATCSAPLHCHRPALRGLTSQERRSFLSFYPGWCPFSGS